MLEVAGYELKSTANGHTKDKIEVRFELWLLEYSHPIFENLDTIVYNLV
jgi:hypothetical protein